MVAVAVTLQELIGLFAGDEHSTPCPNTNLVERICERMQPETVTALRNQIYGADWPNDEISGAEREALAVGYAAWVQAGRPKPH